MMLQRVPAWNEPTVTTTLSIGEMKRETMACRDCTTAAPAVIASTQTSGVAPWPPLPWMVTLNMSGSAQMPPGVACSVPVGYRLQTCRP